MIIARAIISIHALVKRATNNHLRATAFPCYFNPRPREEGDWEQNNDYRKGNYFNPRPREEGDRTSPVEVMKKLHFNPRPREEGDTDCRSCIINATDFNPRPREEGDCISYKRQGYQ